MKAVQAPTLEDIRAARERIAGSAIRTPLIRLNVDGAPGEIYLKLENLQPIGSFKIRGAGNAMRLVGKEKLSNGVYTASAGNMAQGLAWNAREMGVPCEVIVPDRAPETKLAAIKRLGGKVVKVPFDEWWQVIIEHTYPGLDSFFIHPVSDSAVIAGNGTIGLEILEDLPDVETVVIPFGGGGLSSGIAAAIRSLKSNTRIYACEVETAAPLKTSLNAGSPQTVDYTPSFVDGIGGRSVLKEMWPLVSSLIDDSLVVSLQQVSRALKLLIERNRVLAEGAGAAAVAAALSGMAGSGKIVCIVSGGNIDFDKLAEIIST
ncbi:threonine/serine dehydratase [candidate division KSB1 bacterium]|nr:threonine/serine dehydratase [candidate division KSB1 bacterium]